MQFLNWWTSVASCDAFQKTPLVRYWTLPEDRRRASQSFGGQCSNGYIVQPLAPTNYWEYLLLDDDDKDFLHYCMGGDPCPDPSFKMLLSKDDAVDPPPELCWDWGWQCCDFLAAFGWRPSSEIRWNGTCDCNPSMFRIVYSGIVGRTISWWRKIGIITITKYFSEKRLKQLQTFVARSRLRILVFAVHTSQISH